jgi:hypothetical protein
MTPSDSQSGPTVRRATPADLPTIGRLGALLVGEHHDFDPQRFLAAGRGTPKGYASFMSTQLEDPDAAVLVADYHGEVIGYAYAAVEGYGYMSLRGPAGSCTTSSSTRGTAAGASGGSSSTPCWSFSGRAARPAWCSRRPSGMRRRRGSLRA